MEHITSAQADPTTPQKASRRATILSLASSMAINVALPLLLYLALKRYTGASDFLALVISGVPSLIDSVVGVMRRKRIDLLAGIVLASIVISLLLVALGSSPKVYLVRESFFTAAFGLVYLISLLFKRPLAFYFARYFATGNHPENVAWFDSLWQSQQFRYTMRVITVVWGVGLLFEAVLRTFLVMMLSIEQFLIASPFVLYGIIGSLIVWMLLYSRQGRIKGEAIRQRMQSDKSGEVLVPLQK